MYGWSEADTDYEAKALEQANRAIALAPDNLRAYLPKALYPSMSRRPNEALGAAMAGSPSIRISSHCLSLASLLSSPSADSSRPKLMNNWRCG